jgi:hypothetical protein
MSCCHKNYGPCAEGPSTRDPRCDLGHGKRGADPAWYGPGAEADELERFNENVRLGRVDMFGRYTARYRRTGKGTYEP